MLKGIPSIISPELMQVLMSMGHGDEIVLADGNFPAATNAQRLVRADGHGVAELLKAILKFFPLDTYVEDPAVVMAVVAGDDVDPVIWKDYARILGEAEGREIELTVNMDRCHLFQKGQKGRSVFHPGQSQQAHQ